MNREERRRLSKLSFEALEMIEMYQDVVEARTGKTDKLLERLIAEIKAYREEKGWCPVGFGGED